MLLSLATFQLNQVRQLLVSIAEAEQLSELEHNAFLERFDELLVLLSDGSEDSQYVGQEIISQIFMRYPQITHLVPRDLLWYFGGDCLHFMPDEEIDMFQQLSDLQYEAQLQEKPFDWLEEKQHLWLKANPSS